MEHNYDNRFKILLLGDSGVGKSSIMERFCDNKHSTEPASTIGIDFRVQNIKVGDKIIKLQIFDTGGHSRFRSITMSYYRSTQGVIFIYDITNKNAFIRIRDWITDFKQRCIDSPEMIIIGNKSDLESDREVSYEEGKNLAAEYDCSFFEISAKTGVMPHKKIEDSEPDTVDTAFRALVSLLLNKEGTSDAPPVRVDIVKLSKVPESTCSC